MAFGDTNGVPTDWDDDAAMEKAFTVPLQEQIRDIAKIADDIRASVAHMAVQQAVTSGEVKVLATKLDGFEERIEPRIEALESGRARDEWRAWAERLAAFILGGGALQVVQHLLPK